MNEQLQKQLAEMLAKLTAVAQDAGKFAADQIPPLVQEKIAVGRAEESLWMLFALALFAGAAIASRYLWRWVRRNDWDEDLISGAVLGQLVLGGLGLLPVLLNLHSFLLVWFAPRLYIVDWLREMAAGR